MLRLLALTALRLTLREGPYDKWIASLEAFAAVTKGGAAAPGRCRIGALIVGTKADIAL